MGKIRPIIVDYDCTLINSKKAICDIYNKTFSNREEIGFTPADWTKVTRWDMIDQCTLLKKYGLSAVDLFKVPEFFEVVEFYEGALETFEKLSKETKIIVCTAGTPENVSSKVLHIDKYMPYADIVPVIIKDSSGYGKQIVNMEGAIFIDDHATNLETSNAEVKICFGGEYDWNRDFSGLRFNIWSATEYNILRKMIYSQYNLSIIENALAIVFDTVFKEVLLEN